MTKRPDVALENFEQVYAFYSSYRPSRVPTLIGLKIMNRFWPVELEFANGAEEQLEDAFASNTRLAMGSNHFTDRDHNILGSFVESSKTLEPLRGNISMPAKESVFTHDPVQRRLVDGMGGVPAFRFKDVFKNDGEFNELVGQRNLHAAAGIALRQTFVSMLNDGRNMATFFEGERNKINPREVQGIKHGTYDIITAVNDDVKVATLPLGIYYAFERVEEKHGKLKIEWDYASSCMYIGNLITKKFDSDVEYNSALQSATQICLNNAIRMVQERWGENTILPEQELVDALRTQEEQKIGLLQKITN